MQCEVLKPSTVLKWSTEKH